MSAELVTFDILINGKAISDTTNVVSIELEQNTKKNTARVELLATADTKPISVNKEFTLGASIEIKLGYDEKNNTAFKGKISDKGVRFSQEEGVRNVFICEDNTPKKVSGSAKIDPNNVFNIDLGCNSNDKVEGGIELQGTLNYAAGNTLSLSNIVEGFPKAPIYSVIHDVSEGNWFTTLHFNNNETEHSRIELATERGNKIVLDDKSNTITLQDANNNSLVLSASGINIKSPKNISITADQEITFKGKQGVSQEASGGDVEIKGMNTNIIADMEASLEGSMTTSVKGGAQLTLKGAMVMIN